jgi:ABC-type glucose/galactose transport system permease subunit
MFRPQTVIIRPYNNLSQLVLYTYWDPNMYTALIDSVVLGTAGLRLPHHGTKLHILCLVPVVTHTVFRTPDDGCKEHPKHVEKSWSEIKYKLLMVHLVGNSFILIRLVMHGTMNVKSFATSRTTRQRTPSHISEDLIFSTTGTRT